MLGGGANAGGGLSSRQSGNPIGRVNDIGLDLALESRPSSVAS